MCRRSSTSTTSPRRGRCSGRYSSGSGSTSRSAAAWSPSSPRSSADRHGMANVSTIEGIRVSADHWIGGSRVPSSDMFLDLSPIDLETLAMVARGGKKEADAAVAAARDAFPGWAATEPKQRSAILHRVAELVEAHVRQLAVVETRDNGSLLRSMQRSVMPRVARNFRFFADHLLTLGEDTDYDGFAEHVEWDPSGVTAVITRWNAPL